MPHMCYRLRNIEFLTHKPCSGFYSAGGASVEKLSVKRISSLHLEWLANSAEMANDKERGYKRTIKTNCTLKSGLYLLPLILMCFVQVLSQWVYQFVTGKRESFSETIGKLANLLPLSVFHPDDAVGISLLMGLNMLPNISEVAFIEKFSIVSSLFIPGRYFILQQVSQGGYPRGIRKLRLIKVGGFSTSYFSPQGYCIYGLQRFLKTIIELYYSKMKEKLLKLTEVI